MQKPNNISLIILAGGNSSRMGTDKALLKLNGKTFVQTLYDNLKDICEDVIISTNNPKINVSGAKIIADEIKNIGPMGGLYTCIKQIKTDYTFVVTVDTPLVSKKLLQKIFSQSGTYDISVIKHNNKVHPLIGVYRKNITKLLETEMAQKKYKVMKLIEKTKHQIISVSNEYEKELFNVNSKEDYEHLKK